MTVTYTANNARVGFLGGEQSSANGHHRPLVHAGRGIDHANIFVLAMAGLID